MKGRLAWWVRLSQLMYIQVMGLLREELLVQLNEKSQLLREKLLSQLNEKFNMFFYQIIVDWFIENWTVHPV